MKARENLTKRSEPDEVDAYMKELKHPARGGRQGPARNHSED